MAGEKHGTWGKWLSLVEWSYNTTYHSTIKTTPFEAIYGYQPLLHIPYFPKDSCIDSVELMLRDREESIKLRKFHLERERNLMSQVANRNRELHLEWATSRHCLPNSAGTDAHHKQSSLGRWFIEGMESLLSCSLNGKGVMIVKQHGSF